MRERVSQTSTLVPQPSRPHWGSGQANQRPAAHLVPGPICDFWTLGLVDERCDWWICVVSLDEACTCRAAQPPLQPLRDRHGNIVKANDQRHAFWLNGCAEQLVVNPADLQRSGLQPRDYTGWGYGEGDIDVSLVGVPILQTNWRESK